METEGGFEGRGDGGRGVEEAWRAVGLRGGVICGLVAPRGGLTAEETKREEPSMEVVDDGRMADVNRDREEEEEEERRSRRDAKQEEEDARDSIATSAV